MAMIIVTAVVVESRNLRHVYLSSDRVAHTHQFNAALQSLLTRAVDAETSQRGFVITGDVSHLEPYTRARDAIPGAFTAVRSLTADNAAQLADLDLLEAETKSKLAELAYTIEQGRTGGLAAARASVATNFGRRTMDRMRAIVARMERREGDLLATRSREATLSYRTAQVTGLLTGGVALLGVLGLFLGMRRVERQRRRIEELAENLDVTLDSIGDAVITTDCDGRVIRMNPVAAHLTGWTEGEAVGLPLERVLVIVNEHTRQPAENPVERVLREHVVVGLANHTVLIGRDGHEVPIDDSAAPIVAADGTVVGVVMVFRDIAARREAERAELEARRDAERANRTKDEFLAMVSHELRTPLNAVVGWAELLRHGDLPEARRTRAIEAIHSNARRQAVLIDELLDVARIISGKLQIEPAPVHLPTLVHASLDAFQPAADEKRVHLSADIDANVGTFHTDAPRFQQILGNLVSNAIKFTPGDGQVRVSVRRQDDALVVTVSDTGCGIAPEFLHTVFEPFRQGDPLTTRHHGGLGLGLSIVRRLVEAHGGRVHAESAGVGSGATFVVRLPARAITAGNASAVVEPVASSDGAPPAAADPLDGVAVLVVDDDGDTRELLAAVLEHAGATVLTADSAARALALVATSRIDVLLSDIAMPGEDGYVLMRRVRALGTAAADVPALALTSLARDDDMRAAIDAGFDRHLAKPVDVSVLVGTVDAMVREDGTRRPLLDGTRDR